MQNRIQYGCNMLLQRLLAQTFDRFIGCPDRAGHKSEIDQRCEMAVAFGDLC